jgi:predicted dehydrogenase
LETPRLAVIGCGAVTKNLHLPAIALSAKAEATVLVDRILPRAQELADKYDVPDVAREHQKIIGKADAAIVALPHYLHGPVTTGLLRHGIHVLVEKPMAISTSECDQMIAAARETGAVLAVGLVRRFYAASQFVKEVIDAGILGEIVNFDLCEGGIYSWQSASSSMYRKESGGGVLTGIGPHGLDLLLWWLGDCEQIAYYDDAYGGVEANCRLDLWMQCGATGRIELSRTRQMRNSWIIRGERGSLEVGTGHNATARLQAEAGDIALTGQSTRAGAADANLQAVFVRQLEDFLDAVRTQRQPAVPGEEGRRSIALLETCQLVRKPLKYPWVFPQALAHNLREVAE